MVAEKKPKGEAPKQRNRKVYFMERRNRLKIILTDLGLETMKPSEVLLEKLGVARKRFYQIMENKGKNELTVLEKENLEKWLAELMNKSVSEISLMEDNESRMIITKHKLS
ncbi:hypothetical protein EFA69_16035 [Rufibacter immobilis]|uniref:Uncharacterized protein n=1 Tax=Rufibacter immobilis TaxID=1348778 RepID=A0A3M9MQ38_9BACT|nr:hypothetical protein [Rufibacter immobilis]RNI27626.1 hypothetical protein EFA69_16035 [Rufibacter immobilis]